MPYKLKAKIVVYIVAILFILFFTNYTQAQYVGDSLSNASSYLFKKNHFSLELENGLLKGNLNVNSGNPAAAPNNSWAFLQQAGFNYAFNHSNNFSSSVKLGMGFFPAYYRMPNEEYYLFKYWENLSGSEFINLSVGLEYRKPLNKRITGFIKASTSYYFFNNVDTKIGSSQALVNVGLQKTSVNFLFDNKANWTTEILLGNYKKLHNHNLFKYGLKLNYAFTPLYTGFFYTKVQGLNQPTFGTISSNNLFLAFHMSYIFSKAAKQASAFDLKQQYPDKSAKEIKRLVKQKQQLKANKNNLLIAVNTGFNMQGIKANDANFVYKNTTTLSAALNLDVAYLFSQTNFVEASIGRLAYYIGNKNSSIEAFDCFICGSYSNAFEALQVKIGLGKRLLNKKQYSLINLHAGASLVYTTAAIGLSGKGYFTEYSDTTIVFRETHNNYQLKKIFPLIYLGLSKDLKISPVLFIRLAYQAHIGFMPVFESKYTYWSQSIPENKFATYYFNGGFHTFQLGVVYKLEL
jgi:hypothetical protein